VDLEDRLETLRKAKGLTKQELYDELEISRSLVSAIKTGDRALSVKVRRRLEDAETEAGLVWTEPRLHDQPGGASLNVQLLRDEILETMFKSLAEDLKTAEAEGRSQILRMLDEVHAELVRRRDRTGGQIPPEKPASSGTPEGVATTLAGVVQTAGLGTGGSEGSSQPSGAGEHGARGRVRPRPSAQESKPRRPGHVGGGRK